MNGYKYYEDFRIDFESGNDVKHFDIEVDFYVHDGSGRKLPATTRIECVYDPSADEALDEPYFAAYISELPFDGTTSESSAYLVLDGVMLEDLCPGLGYNLPYELDRFQVCLYIDMWSDPEGGRYFKVRVTVYQMVLACKVD
jgi:hypothetical protein